MSNIVLDVHSVGKCFATYRNNLLRCLKWFGLPFRPMQEYWAVRDVSFTLEGGQALALIGQNGAGKSTLLKLITGTLRPTTGNIAVNGRVSAILELGLGFNPEFTGRQNVYLSGGLMGLSNHQIDEIIPAIKDFSELGEFFDQPLRVYSSGMQARLAFSVVTAIRPDVLIVDEVLSVGDSYFQHKSFDKIRRFKEEGTSILLVTHSMSDVRELCDRVILLDNGKIQKDGHPEEIVDYYNAIIAEKENARLSVEQRRQKNGWVLTRSGNFGATMKNLMLLDETTQEVVDTARVGQKLVLRLTASINEEIPRLVLGYMLRDRTGHVVWGTNTWHTRQVIKDLKKGDEVEFRLNFTCTLGPGSYSFSPALVSSDTHLENNYEWVDNALVFDVVNADKGYFIGTSWLDAVFQISRR